MFLIRGRRWRVRQWLTHVTPVENPEDAMIVTSVPEREGELREGTLLKTKMMEYAFDGVYGDGNADLRRR